ncbi:hypothetical protein [Tamilnaduibacter salinus]|uniref:hypothetical protein n=1 Tax=Tamilnaduibacter salinus TaxID=1484056 RepID=UPI001B809751|nr:hypothetical protein [Tamilnaduibacter salinus]
MEYDVHALEEIQPRAEGMDSEDAPMEEGVAYFHYARRNLRRRRQAGEVGWIYTFFWYLYHLMTFWTVPNRLVEWENRKLAHLVNRRLPPAMAEWSKPLPESDWARPSEELVRLSQRVRTILKAHPERDITEVHASVYEQSGDAEALRA